MNSRNDILLVNRDKTYLDYLVGILSPSGYPVHTAMEMRGALSTLAGHTIKLIICGKELQDVSGYDFVRFLKSDPLRESIPVMFVVSIKDQGRPFTAFELGAVDFVVSPVEPQELIGRIDEALKRSPRKDPVAPPDPVPPPAAPEAPQESAPAPADRPVPDLKIDVSRDGVIWLAGIVKRFRRQGLAIETALFGKAGVRLMLRFRLADGMFIVNGRIKEMSFDDFQKPTGISVIVDEDATWNQIHAELEKSAASGVEPQPGQEPEAAPQNQKTVIISRPAAENQDISGTQFIEAAEQKKAFYDIRFYHSLIGKQLDNYRAITLIGSGTMGGVLQGWDVALEREVALKIISYELSCKQEFCDMFIKEARVVSRLNHPNIAQIYAIGSSNQILYYAMELIDGETLKDILNREGTLSSARGMEYLLTICETMDFVFRNGVVHRDIKPANIMINAQGTIKLVDFGVARDTRTARGMKNVVMGTPLYMSPEQIAGLALDHRSDMYSLGATFYHAFGGTPPFESGDFKEILDRHLNTPPIPLRERNPKTAPALCKIIEKMLAKDPNDRYKDFQVIVSELKTLRSRVNEAKRALPA